MRPKKLASTGMSRPVVIPTNFVHYSLSLWPISAGFEVKVYMGFVYNPFVNSICIYKLKFDFGLVLLLHMLSKVPLQK